MTHPAAPWTSVHSRYLLTEIVAGIVITAVLSDMFAWLVFGRSLPVGVDTAAFRIDAAAQVVIVAFMSALVPTLLARRRRANGVVSAAGRPHAWPRGAVARGIVIALAVAPAALLAHAALLRLLPGLALDLVQLLLWKSLLGIVVAVLATTLAVKLAIAD